jgi:murein peptide amidase A
MTATLVNPVPTQPAQRVFERRPIERLLAPLENLASGSDHFFNKTFGRGSVERGERSLPRYLYLGPRGGGDVIRIGIFATIHGDEP